MRVAVPIYFALFQPKIRCGRPAPKLTCIRLWYLLAFHHDELDICIVSFIVAALGEHFVEIFWIEIMILGQNQHIKAKICNRHLQERHIYVFIFH